MTEVSIHARWMPDGTVRESELVWLWIGEPWTSRELWKGRSRTRVYVMKTRLTTTRSNHG